MYLFDFDVVELEIENRDGYRWNALFLMKYLYIIFGIELNYIVESILLREIIIIWNSKYNKICIGYTDFIAYGLRSIQV